MSHSHHYNHPNKEPWWKEAWRPAAAAVYLIICLLDFGIMPLIYEWINASLTNQSLVDLALKFSDPAAQIQALQTLKMTRVWVPLTLQGNGMFHIAFGAILGITAFTRGQEKAAWASVGMQPGGYSPMGQYQQPYYPNNNMGGGFNGFPQNNGFQPNFGQPNVNGMNNMPNNNNTFKPVNPINTPKTEPAVAVGPSVNIVNPDDTTNE
jgi:hypothetical protein